MSVISEAVLRTNTTEILRRAEAGEHFTVIVAGRPIAHLGPVHRRQWVSTNDLMDIWRQPVDPGLARDLDDFGGELRSF
jgi:antitoxin (DNA-binding transcriptional repressor) of toxin-antitoxin stability system